MSNRREFLKGAVTGAVAAAAAPYAVQASASEMPKKWDMTADVVVCGFGGAGATTAIVAAQNGASVI
ncbi:twin-arginine translocation signal domain-containing protein, partial [Sutterella massiliensis]